MLMTLQSLVDGLRSHHNSAICDWFSFGPTMHLLLLSAVICAINLAECSFFFFFFLTSLCCFPRSCTLPTRSLINNTCWLVLIGITDWIETSEASKFCSSLTKSSWTLIVSLMKWISNSANCPDVSQWFLYLLCTSSVLLSPWRFGDDGGLIILLCLQNCFPLFFSCLPAFLCFFICFLVF